MSHRLRIETSHGNDLRWAVFDRNELLLQLCGLCGPDGSMDLVGTTERRLNSLQLAEVSETLLRLAFENAAGMQVDRIRALVWDETPAVSIEALRKYGFQPTAVLHCWSTDCVGGGAGGEKSVWQPLRGGVEDLGESAFCHLVAATLDDSLDLAAMDRPSPEMLLEKWSQLSSPMTLICRQGDAAAGLAILTVDRKSATATLEYIGVTRACRRQGLGRRLLASVRAYVAKNLQPRGPWRLDAYCDTQNVPAVQLYRSNGFTRQGGSTIWTCEVTGSHNEQRGT